MDVHSVEKSEIENNMPNIGRREIRSIIIYTIRVFIENRSKISSLAVPTFTIDSIYLSLRHDAS
jgi:hypothetical protein